MTPDEAYSNASRVPDADRFPPLWEREAAAFRDALGPRARLGLAYGPGARQGFDLFLPGSDPRGLVVFVHGGYWKSFARDSWSHFAAGPLARGWAVAMPSYTLAPEARLADMTREIGAAVAAAAAQVAGPVVVTGHSAGGHLSARMGCADAPTDAAGRIARVVPISPLADLDPLRETTMNEVLHIDAAEAAAESPARLPLRAGTRAHVWVGGLERPAFLWQARLLSEAWGCPWTVDPGLHHFDVIDGLLRSDSALTEALVAGL